MCICGGGGGGLQRLEVDGSSLSVVYLRSLLALRFASSIRTLFISA